MTAVIRIVDSRELTRISENVNFIVVSTILLSATALLADCTLIIGYITDVIHTYLHDLFINRSCKYVFSKMLFVAQTTNQS